MEESFATESIPKQSIHQRLSANGLIGESAYDVRGWFLLGPIPRVFSVNDLNHDMPFTFEVF